ncbi:chemotaxis protein W [Oceanisphaera marina]|uniref:Chemotaxis protein W n=1 Tax=Oceanisphaera marina TaxID=2017550 RepID=A0ABQ1IL22_9GAMM|nr:chemotaxis protein CheW [Oceanisphaera marina]GGB45338.1 chemotaxis protein W [Oceanisphaera marina]
MNQRHSDALDDYFGSLLEEGPAVATQPSIALEQTASMPFADPEEEARRLALETLLARVAELKEEETPPVLAEPEQKPAVETPVPVAEPTPIPVPEPVAPPVIQESEPEPETSVQVEPLPAAPAAAAPPVIQESEPEPETSVQVEPLPAAPAAAEWRNMDTEHSFQVLFFEVAGMTFAVPLTHLGGIYQMSKLTNLFGKPAWFAGMLTERERQLYVVDTARWAMPGHTAEEQYQYLVTLGESNWGLGCHQLKGTAQLTREQVKWRATPGARPWLAGMVKEKMCALLHVDALIGLLEQGKNIDGQQV